jgi:4-hydroxy-3-methylbut-2-en-1-yl diphosphate reductase
MHIIRAETMGMCFGVRAALATIGTISAPGAVTIHGQLVHNEAVLSDLAAAGFSMSGEDDRREVPETPFVLITAHGISDRERSRLASAGKSLIDTTCPLVTRAHLAAARLQAEGFYVVVIGKPGHVEVRGIVEDLEHFEVVQSIADVRSYPHNKIGIICQTTTSTALGEAIRAEIVSQNPQAEVRYVDTICHPTKDNQEALERLLGEVEAVVVVGGRNSNNTRELVALCRSKGRPALHVSTPDELDADWLRQFETIGLTAGTSTLDSTIDAVHQRMREMTDLLSAGLPSGEAPGRQGSAGRQGRSEAGPG